MDLQSFLSSSFMGNTGMQYAVATGIFLGMFLLLFLIRTIFLVRLEALAKKTKNNIDDFIISLLTAMGWPLYFLFSLYLGAKYLVLNSMIDKIIDYMLIIMLSIYGTKVLFKAIEFFTGLMINKRDDDDDTLLIALRMLLKIAVAVVAVLLVLSNIGINIASLLAGLGVGGIAIAFALQKILEDIFSSFSIYFDKPFQVGDFIIIGEDMGTVMKIGLKTTRIKHLMGQELVVSNRELTSARINNYKKMKKRRISFSFGVEYGTPSKKLEKINKIVKEVILENKKLQFDRSHFKEFGDSSLNYEVVYYIDSGDYNEFMDAQQDINLELYKKFEKEGIEFAFPTQTVHIKK